MDPVDVDVPIVPTPLQVVPVTWRVKLVAGLLLFALLSLSVGVVVLSRVANRIEGSAECRFDENAEISDVNDEIDLWTARGLAASVRRDQDGVNEALQNIDSLSAEFEHLIEGRGDIVERCDEGG